MSIAARCTCDRKGSGFRDGDGYCPRHSPRRPLLAREPQSNDRHPDCIYPLCGCGSTADCKQDPLNTPLPCDVQVGHTTFRKGVALRSLVLHANRLRDELHQRWADALANAVAAPAPSAPADQPSPDKQGQQGEDTAPAGAPGATDAERAAWLADKIVAGGDYAKEAAAMLRRWPVGVGSVSARRVAAGLGAGDSQESPEGGSSAGHPAGVTETHGPIHSVDEVMKQVNELDLASSDGKPTGFKLTVIRMMLERGVIPLAASPAPTEEPRTDGVTTCPRCKQPAPGGLYSIVMPGDELETMHCGCLHMQPDAHGVSASDPQTSPASSPASATEEPIAPGDAGVGGNDAR